MSSGGYCPIHGEYGADWPECPYCFADRGASGGGGGLPTRVRGPALSGGGRGDDRTRARMPALGSQPGRGRVGDDATRHVKQVGSGRPGGRGRDRRTVRMGVVPERFGWLIVKKGQRVGQVYPLQPEVTDLGRGPDNDIVVDDEKVSEEHARIRVDEEGRFVVWDLASTNGTFLNGEKVTAATPLVENDEIRVGHTVLVVKTLELGEDDEAE